MMYVSVLSIERNLPWIFIAPEIGVKRPPTTKLNKETSGLMFVDASHATYALFPTPSTPLFHVDEFLQPDGSDPSFISDEDFPSDKLPVLPISSTALIYSPTDIHFTSVNMLHIHLLHVAKSSSSSLSIPDTETHREITRNYHELAVLAAARWKLHANAMLPLHLGALEVMCSALRKEDLN